MPCHAPAFWWKKPGMAANALRPVARLYDAASSFRQKRITPYKPLIPVICVGNVVAGGAGKTPAVQALAALLFNENITKFPAILLRGYGGKLHGPTNVNPGLHHYKEVGDEALLHAMHAPTIISRDRAAGVQLAQLSGADFIFMDDGLQNPSVAKTLSFLMVDESQGIGNGLTLPAGPLRETLKTALARVEAIILNGETLPFKTDKPVFRARLVPTALPDTTAPFVAFAGLGRPEKFKKTLEESGATIAAWHAFPDHHAYSDADIDRLIREADEKNAALVTTEKDYMRIPASFRGRIQFLPVTMVFDDALGITRFIRDRLPR